MRYPSVVMALALIFALFLSPLLLTYQAINEPTFYVKSSLYPLVYYIGINGNKIIYYGLNQSNGTACIISAKEELYAFNFTTQQYYINQTIQITNRTDLVLSAESIPSTYIMLPNQGVTLVCPPSDFAKR